MTSRLEEISLLSNELLDKEKHIFKFQSILSNRKNLISEELNKLAKEEILLNSYDRQLADLDDRRNKKGKNKLHVKRSNILVKFPEEDTYSNQGIWPTQVLEDATLYQQNLENYCYEVNLKEKALAVESRNVEEKIKMLEGVELEIFDELKKDFDQNNKLQEEFQDFISTKGITEFSHNLESKISL